MKNLARWLAGIEQKAADFYSESAQVFTADTDLSQFLHKLADDERQHCRLMRKALNIFSKKESVEPLILVDEETKRQIIAPIAESHQLLCQGELTKDSLLACIFHTEFSEWNDIFLYVAEAISSENRECISAIAGIQRHKRSIERFFESLPEGKAFAGKMKKLPPVWEEKILVVDDFAPFTGLMQALLQEEGLVETAENGEEALAKTKQHYFSIIVSDVDMPVMNGMDFYREATELFPSISDRFLFITGDAHPERTAFFTDNNLRYMEKPAPIQEIKDHVYSMMNRAVEKRLSLC